ncbi:Alpha/Beta hydrolase protein [Aspergillus alliaceus]|uniref:feruloyl esterase n=1 Tax=Petromyces alliaceus TaxID=209559 RepID=A0A5N7BW45_PETAA|nr:Alpha/Beta hydrolase protein [Aspergillus alliaceus]
MRSPLAVLILTIGIASATGSAGCGQSISLNQGPGSSQSVIFTTSDGIHRPYRIYIPSSYSINTPTPLIFSFHGWNRSLEWQESLTQFSNETWNPDTIAVYPQAREQGRAGWQRDSEYQGIDDITFIMELLDDLQDKYCINPTRIYVTGKSDGGGFANDLACDKIASTRIAAFAPVSGCYFQDVSEEDCHPNTVPIKCTPGRSSVPILEFHGTADIIVPYEGGKRPQCKKCLPSIPHYIRQWSKRLGYGLHSKTTKLYDGNVWKFEYGHKGKLGIVTHYRIDGLGHAWPSTEPNNDNPDGTYFEATPIIMDFFRRWSLPDNEDINRDEM